MVIKLGRRPSLCVSLANASLFAAGAIVLLSVEKHAGHKLFMGNRSIKVWINGRLSDGRRLCGADRMAFHLHCDRASSDNSVYFADRLFFFFSLPP